MEDTPKRGQTTYHTPNAGELMWWLKGTPDSVKVMVRDQGILYPAQAVWVPGPDGVLVIEIRPYHG